MRSRVLASVTTVALSGAMLFGTVAPASAAAPAAPAAATQAASLATATPIPITGSDATQSFTGTFRPTGFTNQNGQLAVTGVVSGTLTNLLTGVRQTVSQTVTTTVQSAQASGTCKILNLVLGPLHLDLLGLNIDLNQVVLNITAQSGPGNLLGNLLCSVAGLLDGSGLNGLANLLNRLLGL